jgi:hypothetical protein
MAFAPKRKADTETLLTEARANLAAIESRQAELDAKRLEIEPTAAIKSEIELAAARKDAELRIEKLKERAADELAVRQKNAQAALIARVDAMFAKRDQHIEKLAHHLAEAVREMQGAIAENSKAAVAWPWDGVRDGEPALLGLFLRTAVRHELYQLSGNPYLSADQRGGFEFPGAECPSPFRDPRPESRQATCREGARGLRICGAEDAPGPNPCAARRAPGAGSQAR